MSERPLADPSGLWQSLVGAASDLIAQPLLSFLDVPPTALSPHELSASLLIAFVQVGVIAFVFRPLESWKPAESWEDRRLTRVDRQYTLPVVLGVEPSEFALLMLVGELIQDFSHANVRIGFGRFLEKVIVGPRFHRLHHMRADPGRPGLHDCNYSQAFPLWDILFGTGLYGEVPRITGVSDPVVDADNGHGLLAQQWLALRRFWGAVRRRSGWRLGDVSFGPGYRPVRDALRPMTK